MVRSGKAILVGYAMVGSLGLNLACSTSEPTPSGNSRNSKTPASPATATQPGETVYLLLDGFATCPNFSSTDGAITGTNMLKILDDLKAELKKANKGDPKYLVSCFGTAPNTVYYSTSEYPKFTQFASLSDFTAKVNQQVAKTTNAQVRIVGYSYGGWTAMKVAKDMELKDAAKITSLVTIDPISVPNCTPNDFVGSLDTQAAKGCTEAPSDFTSDDVAKIKGRAKVWSNFYQTDQTILHSGEIAGSDNTKLTLSPPSTAHGAIVADNDLHSKLTALLTK